MTELCDFGSDLFICTENMSIILDKAADAHCSVKCSARFITYAVTEFCKSHREVFVASCACLENLKSTRAVHRLYSENAFFAFSDEHILLIVSPVAGFLPERAGHDGRCIYFHVAVCLNLFSHIFLKCQIHCPSVRMPEYLAGIFIFKMTKIHLYTELTVVALVSFFKHLEIIGQIIRFCKTCSIDAGKH